MNEENLKKEFDNLDWDFRNTPNIDQAVKHEKTIIFNFLRAITRNDVKKPQEIARYILTHVRFI